MGHAMSTLSPTTAVFLARPPAAVGLATAPRRRAATRWASAMAGWCFAATAAWAQSTAPDAALLAAATAEQPATVKTLERLVNVESGSGNAEGLTALGNLLDVELRALGATVSRSRSVGIVPADNIVGRIPGRAGGRKLLLIAHMDTVYEKGKLADAPFRIDGNKAYGPGIADDKGGIAVILHTLKLLKDRGFADHGGLTVMFNTDEERGSNGSKALIQSLAAEHDATLSFEPTSTPKEIMTLGTSGIAYVHVRIKGLAAHAGANPEAGVNALVEASDLVLRTLDLDNKAGGVRFNWTVGKGGSVSNVIPDEAHLEANVRYGRNEDLDALLATLRERIAKKRLPAAELELKVIPGRPAFQATPAGRQLVERAQAIYREVGGELSTVPLTGGGTDAAYAALGGKPVIEGLGLPGAGYHSTQAEYVAIDAIPRRLYLAARLVMELAAPR